MFSEVTTSVEKVMESSYQQKMNFDMIPYLLLLLAVLAAWMSNRISLLFIGFAIGAGTALGTLTPISFIAIAVLGLSIWLPTKFQFKRLGRAFCYGVFLALALALLSHVVPGFHNLPIYQDVQFSPDSIPFTMYLNFDQTLVGLFLLLFFLKPRQAPFEKRQLVFALKVLCLLSGFVFTVVIAIRFVRFDLKFPVLGWIWILNNLFFVCLAEEGLFRGFIQKGLSEVLPKYYALVLASLLFGLAHYQGGATLIGLATIAGLFFGYTYQRTNRIEASILVHFGLNLIHFLFFSYPALIR